MALTLHQQHNVNMTTTTTTTIMAFHPESALTVAPTIDEELERLMKKRELEEFYQTYDPWTGIRTAITLALFFIFSVTIILYKSKCKRGRKYELYPSLEDMPGRPLDYYDYWCSSPGSHDADKAEAMAMYFTRCETGSAPLPTQRSIDSYSSLNNSFRVKSLPGSVMRMNSSRNSSFERDDTSQAHSVRSEYLSVPGVRLQSTGSSSDGYSMASSSHELPAEMTPLTLLGVPRMGPRGNKPLLQLGGMDWDSENATAEWVQTIDINVIQPTPNISPCGSVRSVTENSELARLPIPGRGRITSVVSLDSPEFDNRSIGSDSVFMEDTISSRSESIDSPSPSLLASPRPSLTPSPRTVRHKIQSFRLGINPSPVLPSSPVPSRTQSSEEPSQLDRKARQKTLQRQMAQMGQELPLLSPAPMSSLAIPMLGSHLRSSCERLAAHSSLDAAGSSHATSHASLAPTDSTEEPQCAVFTVPSLRRCNSATVPENQEPSGWKRSDSAQAPVVRRSDSATGPQKQSSESSSGSDDASESVSFHLMVPALSIDIPSNDTSRASSPSLSPPLSNSSPPPSLPTASFLQMLEPPVSPTPPCLSPNGVNSRGRGKNGRNGNGGNGRNGNVKTRKVLKRQYSQCVPPSPTLLDVPPTHSLPTYVEEDDLEISYSFPAAPPPSPFRAGHALYMRQDSGSPSPRLAARHLIRRDSSPMRRDSSPMRSDSSLIRRDSSPMSRNSSSMRDSSPMRRDSSPMRRDSSPVRRESSPTLLHPEGYHLLRQESTPSPNSSYLRASGLMRENSSPNHATYLRREDSTPSPNHMRDFEPSFQGSNQSRTPSLNREDSSPTFPYRYFQRDDSSASSQTRSASLQHDDSTSSFSRTSTLQNESSFDQTLHLPRQDSSPPPPLPLEEVEDGRQSPSSSVMETPC